jgi:hypothetical protein
MLNFMWSSADVGMRPRYPVADEDLGLSCAELGCTK